MKIAITGKGGVGKTTLSGMLTCLLASQGRQVVALDADPDANLASCLGVPADEPITPISEMTDLIEQRTGSKDNYGGYFKLNPRVDDIPEQFARHMGNIRLLVPRGIDREVVDLLHRTHVGGDSDPKSIMLAAFRAGLADGEAEFVVAAGKDTAHGQDIVVCQSDIQNILRAKAAIYAASAVLLHALDLTFDDVAEIMVAGAFGSFLNTANAVLIGLLPDLPPSKLRFVGNTSLAGAKLAAISTSCYDDLLRTASATTYFELSTDGRFMDEFVSASFFPHTDVARFPRVMAELETRRGLRLQPDCGLRIADCGFPGPCTPRPAERKESSKY